MLSRRVTAVLAAMFALVLLAAPLASAQIGSDEFTETDGFVDATSDEDSTAQDGGGSADEIFFADCNDPALTDEEFDACLRGEDDGWNDEEEAEESAPHGGIAFSIGGFAPPPQPTTPTNPTCATTTLFSDGFQADPATVLGATTLVNWIVDNGNVDVVAGFPGAMGNAIDLDGSQDLFPLSDGTPPIRLKTPITVVAGRTYTVTYRIGTNPFPVATDINVVNVTFGPTGIQNTKLPASIGTYTIETLSFVAAANGTAQLQFHDPDAADRGGVVLDEVAVTESCPA